MLALYPLFHCFRFCQFMFVQLYSFYTNVLPLGVHLREAVAIARRKRYGTGSGTAQHEEQLQRWIRTSDAWVDLSNHKQPAQLVLDVSLWQLRRQFGRLPCFSNEVRVFVPFLLPCAVYIVSCGIHLLIVCVQYKRTSLRLRTCLNEVLKTNSRS